MTHGRWHHRGTSLARLVVLNQEIRVMPKRDKQHEEEQPKESTTKYEGGQGSKTREQQQVMRATNTSGRGEKGPQELL